MPLKESKGNMYDWVTHTWNVIRGECPHQCQYCYMKIFKQNKLHIVEKEFNTDLGSGNFIFIGSGTDMFADYVPHEWIMKVLDYAKKFDNKYLFQSKNPKRILHLVDKFPDRFPSNSVIGTTIETNRIYEAMGKTISPINRAYSMRDLKKNHGYETIITIEPIMDFDFQDMYNLIHLARPTWVNIGADSKNHCLPEPSPEKLNKLIKNLKIFTEVKKKSNLVRLHGHN